MGTRKRKSCPKGCRVSSTSNRDSKVSRGSLLPPSEIGFSPKTYDTPASGLVLDLMLEGGFTREEAEFLNQVL